MGFNDYEDDGGFKTFLQQLIIWSILKALHLELRNKFKSLFQ